MRKENLPGALFFTALSIAMAGATALCAYESYALFDAKKPITQRTRLAYHEYPKTAALCIFALGALMAHLWWGPQDTKQDDEAQ